MSANAVFPFLDVWRIVAALTVLTLHLQMQGFLSPLVPGLQRIGHLAVIVFFVISGYSVAYSAHQLRGRPQSFLVARWSRIYSIAIPAMFFALVLDHAGGIRESSLYPAWQYPKWPLHIAFNSLFLGEHWSFTLRPFSIAPYWSLSYEFWFYALMAVTMLRPGPRRTFAIIIMLLFLGPRICLLLPCWLLGVWVFRMTLFAPGRLPYAGWFASIGFLILGWLWIQSGVDSELVATSQHIDELLQSASGGVLKLQESRYFLADFVVALLFAGAIFLVARDIPASQVRLPRLRAFVGWLAPHTFALYLLHYTFLAFFGAKIPAPERYGMTAVGVAITVLVISLILAAILAPTRTFWSKGIEWLLMRIKKNQVPQKV
jgi:peptidoglycan/LPS O-acetylase OafA/YrhL